MSAINAVAGAFAENSSVVVICCTPNIEDFNCNHIMHHTIGTPYFNHSAECFESVVEKVFTVRQIEGASRTIDESLRLCVSRRKPVYLELSCNLATEEVSPPNPIQLRASRSSDEESLSAAIEEAVLRIHEAAKPVVLVGVWLRYERAVASCLEFLEKLGCAVTVQPSAKGVIDESHPQYIGCFWGPISTPVCEEVVESADLVVACGALFDDTCSVGWTALRKPHQRIAVSPDSVDVCGSVFSGVCMADFLSGLARRVPTRDSSLLSFQRYQQPSPPSSAEGLESSADLTRRHVVDTIQSLVSPESCVVVDSGDAWFIGNELKLPAGATFYAQMQVMCCVFNTHSIAFR